MLGVHPSGNPPNGWVSPNGWTGVLARSDGHGLGEQLLPGDLADQVGVRVADVRLGVVEQLLVRRTLHGDSVGAVDDVRHGFLLGYWEPVAPCSRRVQPDRWRN